MTDMSSETAKRQTDPISLPISSDDHGIFYLQKNALGFFGVLIMTVSAAAPMTAMLGNVPFAVGFGNGIHVPATFILATLVLTIFSIGYAKMARKISSVGGIYSYISHGLGSEFGMMAGLASLASYSIFEASICGIFAFFSHTIVAAHLNINVPWVWFSILAVFLVYFLSRYRIKVSVYILGIILFLQFAILLLFDIKVYQSDIGTNFSREALNILHVTHGVSAGKIGETDISSGAAVVSIFMAFWSWVGFEMAPNYGEETRKPKQIIPIVLYISVLGLGLFYTFTSWCAVSAYPTHGEMLLKAINDSGNFFISPINTFVGPWAAQAMGILMLTSAFACAAAFHATAARYIYSLAREGVLPSFLGRTHPISKAPVIASFMQSFFATLWITLFAYYLGTDMPKAQAYYGLYTMLALLGTMLILILQALLSLSIIVYFQKYYSKEAGLFSTKVCPLIAFVSQICLVFVLVQYLETFGGTGSFGKNIPWFAASIIIFGFAWGCVLRVVAPGTYSRIGQYDLDGSGV